MSHITVAPIATARGCSLVEVLIATTFLVVSLTAVAHLYAVAAYAGRRAKETTFATVLAQQKMEQLAPYAPSGTGSDYVDAHGHVVGGGDVAAPEAAYFRQWSIDPLPTGSGATLVIQVFVGVAHVRVDGEAMFARPLLPGEARLVTLRRRGAF